MKQRNILTVILLSIFTLGIYDLYWLVSTKSVLNRQTHVKIPSIWLLFYPFIALFTALLLSIIAIPHGVEYNDNTIKIINIIIPSIVIFAVFPIYTFWFFKFSKSVNEYTNGTMSTGVTFMLLWLLRFIGVAIIQDHFNSMMQQYRTVQQNESGVSSQSQTYAQNDQGSDNNPSSPFQG